MHVKYVSVIEAKMQQSFLMKNGGIASWGDGEKRWRKGPYGKTD